MPRPKTFEPDQALLEMTDVFWEKGYYATSISDLELATGLNKRSLYNTFGDKEAMFEAVLETYMDSASAMRDVLRQKPSGVSNIKAFFARIKDPGSRGCLLTKTINQSMSVSPRALRLVRANLMELEDLFFANLSASLSRSKARRLATFLSSSYQGISTMSSLDPSPKRLRQIVGSITASLDAEIDKSSPSRKLRRNR